MPRSKQNAGFTLVELLVSVALLGMVVFYLMGTFIVNQKAYMVLDQVTEVQQNARAIADLMEKDLRHAGFLVPTGAAVCGVDNTAQPDTVYVSDADPLLTTNALDGDLGATVSSSVASGSSIVLTVDDVVLDGTAFYDTNADGTPDADFQIGGGIVMTDTLDPTRGSMCGTIEAVNPVADTITLTSVSGTLAATTNPENLVVVPAHEYRIDAAQTDLLRNSMVLARGVEDLQFAVWIDLNDDNIVDVNEYRGNGVDPDYVASAVDHGDSREMRVSLVTRTRSSDVDFINGQEQTTENRTAAGGNDGYRRRVTTSTARLRNVANRS